MTRSLRTLAATLALSVAGCGGGDGPTNPSASVVGTYTLRTVNGQPLPAAVVIAGETLTVTAGRVALNADGTCSRAASATFDDGTGISDNLACTYTVSGNTVSALFADGSRIPMTVTGSTLTHFDTGLSLSYSK